MLQLQTILPDTLELLKRLFEGRGTKKDFIDIYLLLQHYSLDDLLAFYAQKYPNYSLFRALLSLNYFDDADPQAMPKMFIPDSWDDIKTHIANAVSKYQGKSPSPYRQRYGYIYYYLFRDNNPQTFTLYLQLYDNYRGTIG